MSRRLVKVTVVLTWLKTCLELLPVRILLALIMVPLVVLVLLLVVRLTGAVAVALPSLALGDPTAGGILIMCGVTVLSRRLGKATSRSSYRVLGNPPCKGSTVRG